MNRVKFELKPEDRTSVSQVKSVTVTTKESSAYEM